MTDNSRYIVSARKYRPATFRSVVGQKNLTATLKNAISTGRLAQAYLFTGPRGVGKTSCARIFAKTINCLNPGPDGEACGECDSCRAIEQGNSYNLIELDAASNNSVDDIRAINEQVNIPPQVGKYKVFIIDEVHMLSNAAFNAFLKTLEEPPAYVIFILATTEKHKVIPTILSRCQIYDFKRMTVDDMIDHLAYVAETEGFTAERSALGVIARKADGAMRDALSIFDQVAASCRGNVTYEATIESLNVLDYEYFFRLVDALRASDVAGSLLIYKEIRDKGFDSLFFVNGLAQHIRDLMVAADARTISLLEMASDVAERFVSQAQSLPLPWYYAAMKILNDCDFSYRTATNKQLLVEVALIRLCQLLKPSEPPFDGVYRNPPLSNTAQPQSKPAQPVASAPVSAAAPAPAHQAVAAPAQPTPHTAATPQPAPRPHVAAATARPRTTRLSDISNAAQADTTRISEQPVDLSGFKTAWNAFVTANGDKHILVSAMKTAKIEQTSPTDFRVLVDLPASVQAIASAPNLLTFLRQRLGNDKISVHAEMDPSVEIVKPLPPKEFLAQALGNSPALKDFLTSFDAEIV